MPAWLTPHALAAPVVARLRGWMRRWMRRREPRGAASPGGPASYVTLAEELQSVCLTMQTLTGARLIIDCPPSVLRWPVRRARLSALVDPALDRGMAERRGDPLCMRIEVQARDTALHVMLESNWPLMDDDGSSSAAVRPLQSAPRVTRLPHLRHLTPHRLHLEFPAAVDASR